MVKIELPYVLIVRAKGKVYTYYRRDGARHRIIGEFGSEEWRGNYDAIHARFERPVEKTVRIAAGSIAAGLRDYQLSDEFRSLKPKTRRGYQRYIDLLLAGEVIERDASGKPVRQVRSMAHVPVAGLTPKVIKQLRSEFAGDPDSDDYRPSAANGMVTFCRLFVAWANSDRIKKLKTGDGHRPAEEDEIDQFRSRHALDTVKRIAFELALNTGQRGQDVVAMTTADVRGDEIRVVQEKTGERVWIAMTADLKVVLLPWIKDRVGQILVTPTGRPMTEDYFRHMMRDAYDEAALPADFTTHGLRYAAATRIYEVFKSLGYTDDQAWEHVAAITGHATMAMAKKYTAKKRRARLAVEHLDTALRARSAKPGGAV